MRKIALSVLAVLMSYFVFGQATVYTEAPPFDNGTSSNRAPNGTSAHAFMRGCVLVLQSELTGIAANSTLTSFGFTMNTGTNLTAVTGNFTLYLENSPDVAFSKSTTFATAIAPMTSVYASVMTIPTTASSTSVTVTLSTPFTYTGGALYVAYDWASAGPFDLTAAVYRCNYQGLTIGAATGASGSAAPATLGTTNFRPCFLFGVANTYSNDVQVLGTEALGRVANVLGTAQNVKAVIKNGSNTTLTNIGVNLNITGANPFLNTQNISSLASGAVTTVTFTTYTPTSPGLSSMSVTVSSDQNNANNLSTYSQSVTCSDWSQIPATGVYNNGGIGFPTGTGIIANYFLNPVTSTLTALAAAISTAASVPGSVGYGVLLSSTGAIIATTNTITLTSAMMGIWVTYNFALPQNLSPNTAYYFGFAQTTAAVFAMATISSPYVPANIYYSTTLTGGAMAVQNQNLGYLGIDAVFGHTANITVASTPTSMCLGGCATINALGTTNYTWSIGSTSVGITVCPTVTTTYSVIGTNTFGCNSSAAITLTVNPIPTISAASNNATVCLGKTVTLTASGGSTYSWNLGPTTVTISDSPAATTVYTVTGTSAAGCSNTGTVEVVVNSFTPGITSPTAICMGEQINIVSTGGTGNTYTWSTNFNGFPNILITPTITSGYTVTTIGANGCTGSNATTVTVNPNPTITATAQRTLMCKGETNTLTALGAVTYSWTNLSGNPTVVITPSSNITYNYNVTGTNTAGCTNSAVVNVKVSACTGLSELNGSSSFHVNIFPNPAAGLFNVEIVNGETINSIEIYNTLGALVLKPAASLAEFKVDLQQEPNGMYFMHINRLNSSPYVFRIIKQ